MHQSDTEALAQGTCLPGNKYFAKKIKLKKGHNSHTNWQILSFTLNRGKGERAGGDIVLDIILG